jgi:site-specific recombinase XerD
MPTPRDRRKSISHLSGVANPPINNDVILAEYLNYRRTSGRKPWRPETLRVRRYQLHAIAQQLAPTALVDVDEERILAWQAQLRGMSETRASYISTIRGLYRWMAVLARPRLIDLDPTIALERPVIAPAQPRPMIDRHYDLALACSVSDPEMYLWLGLMGCSGLRCCEVAWLMVGDVEQRPDESGLLHLEGKGGKRRTVPVGTMLMLTMKPFLHGRGPVFTRPSDGLAHRPAAVSRRVSVFLSGIGVPAPHRAHSLRHRFGTDYHAIDVDLYRQAELMGHSSVDTTRRYTAISPVEAARHVEELTTNRLASRGRGTTPRYGDAA